MTAPVPAPHNTNCTCSSMFQLALLLKSYGHTRGVAYGYCTTSTTAFAPPLHRAKANHLLYKHVQAKQPIMYNCS